MPATNRPFGASYCRRDGHDEPSAAKRAQRGVLPRSPVIEPFLQVITGILTHLPPLARLTCSLTSRKFAEALTGSTSVFEGIQLVIYGTDINTVVPATIRSQRRHIHLFIFGGMYNETEFTNYGGHTYSQTMVVKCAQMEDDRFSKFRRFR